MAAMWGGVSASCRTTGATVATLVLVVLLSSCEENWALRCYCNHTHMIPLPDCFHNALTCEVDGGMCYAAVKQIQKPPAIVRQWGCMPGQEHGLLASSLCMWLDTPTHRVKCCNESDLCNKDLVVLLPTSTLGALATTSTAISGPTGGGRSEEHKGTSSTSSHSLSTLLIVSIIIGAFIFLFLLTVCFILLFLLLRRRKCLSWKRLSWTVSRDTPRREANNSDSVPLELSEQMCVSTESDPIPTTLAQRTIARSILLRGVIGTREAGQVFLGEYAGDRVAVRRYTPASRFLWQCELQVFNLPLLQDENVIGFTGSDVVTINGLTEYWLVTQYHNLGSLYDYLHDSIISPHIMTQLAVSMCSGLAHLHSEVFGIQAKPAIAHRAITSRNVLVKDDLTCCLSDFHLAVVKKMGTSLIDSPTNLLEAPVRYMAPEMLEETINVKYFGSFKQSDVYAVGMVLWEMCRRCAGPAEPYEVPFQSVVPPTPSFEDMKKVVVMERRKPAIPDRWLKDQLLREMTKMMRECWYFNSTARPTAVYLKKKLLRQSQTSRSNTLLHA